MAIQWDILPNESDDILRHITSMWWECDRYNQYIKAELTRRTLRQVCRSWNQEVGQTRLDKHLVITDFDNYHWPSNVPLQLANCIEFSPSRDYCRCRMPTWSDEAETDSNLDSLSLSRISISSPTISVDPPSAGTEGPFAARALLAERCTKLPPQILEQASLLEMLSWYPQVGDQVQAILSHFKHLTYLSLWRITTQHLETLKGSFAIVTLKYLRLDIWQGNQSSVLPDAANPAKSMSTWKFPALISLMITGLLNTAAKQEVESLVCQCARHITCLVLSFQYHEALNISGMPWWEGTPDKWGLFSHLSTFGVSMEWFFTQANIPESLDGIRHTGSSMTVIIYDFNVCNSWNGTTARNCARNLLKWCGSRVYPIQRIAILQSWKKLTQTIQRQQNDSADMYGNVLRHAKFFFDEIFDGDIAFCDRNGIDLMGEEAWFFIESLGGL
jgi:hypothetical protein